MAEALTQEQKETVQQALLVFNTVRKSLGLEIKSDPSGYDHTDAEQTILAANLSLKNKPREFGPKLFAEIQKVSPSATPEAVVGFVTDLGEAVNILSVKYPKMVSDAQKADIRKSDDMFILRAGLGFKDQEGGAFTQADIENTKKALEALRAKALSTPGRSREHLVAEVMLKNIGEDSGLTLDRIKSALQYAPRTLDGVSKQIQDVQKFGIPTGQFAPPAGVKIAPLDHTDDPAVSANRFTSIRSALSLPFINQDSVTAQSVAETAMALKAYLALNKNNLTPLVEKLNTGFSTDKPLFDEAKVASLVYNFDAIIGSLKIKPSPAPAAPKPADAGAQATGEQAATTLTPAQIKEEADKIRKPKIEAVENTLGALGFAVGKKDGVADADFQKAATQFKDLIVAVSGKDIAAKISQGECKAEDCAPLLEGLKAFLGSKQLAQLEALRKGPVSQQMKDSIAADLGGGLEGSAKAAIFARRLEAKGTEAERIRYVLEEQAKGKDGKDIAAALKKIEQINPEMLNNLDKLLDTMKAQGPQLLKDLKVVYAKDSDLVKATATSSVKSDAGATAPSPQPQAPGQTSAQADASGGTAAAGKPAGAPSPQPKDKKEAEKLNEAIETVEAGLKLYIQPMIGQFTGVLGKFGLNNLIPTLTQEDLTDETSKGNLLFGEKSQRLTAMALMAMKEMAGIQPADGTYTPAIGKELLTKILTDEKMAPIRSKMDLPLLSQNDAKLVLSGREISDPEKKEGVDKNSVEYIKAKEEYDRIKALRDKAKALQDLFASLDLLHMQKPSLLMKEDEAQKVNRNNMMIDVAANFLDKMPWLKKMVVGFLKSEWGQMVVGVAGAMGYDLNRLVGDRSRTPAQSAEAARPAIEGGFKNQYDKARKELEAAGNTAPSHGQIMEKTEARMKDMMEGTGFKALSSVLFKGADDNVIQSAMTAAMAEAKKAPNEAEAAKAFTNKVMALGEEYRTKHKITLDPKELERALQGTAERMVAAEATGSNRTPAAVRSTANIPDAAAFVAPPAQASAQAPAAVAAGAGETSGATSKPVTPGSVQATPLLPAVPKGGIRFEMGERVITLSPKPGSEAESGSFKNQNPVRESKGRMQNLAQVLYDNYDALKIQGVPKDQLGKGDKAFDGATPALAKALMELSVRGQLRMLTNEQVLDTKIDSKNVATYVLTQMKAAGVSDAEVEKAQKALNEMANDFTVKKGQRVTEAQKAKLPSVFDQSFAGYVGYTVDIRQKPAPAPVVAPAAPAVPAAAPAASTTKVDPYVGVKVDDAHKELFEMYKAQSAKMGGVNCAPLFFAMNPDGKIMSAEEYKEKRKSGGDLKNWNIYAGIVDQQVKPPRFEVHVLEETDPRDSYVKNYAERQVLPKDMYAKILDNYSFTVQATERATGKVKTGRVGIGNGVPDEFIPGVVRSVENAINGQLGFSLVADRSVRATFDEKAKPAASSSATAPADERAAQTEREKKRAQDAERQEREAADARQRSEAEAKLREAQAKLAQAEKDKADALKTLTAQQNSAAGGATVTASDKIRQNYYDMRPNLVAQGSLGVRPNVIQVIVGDHNRGNFTFGDNNRPR